MPTLFRIFAIIAVLFGIVFGLALILTSTVEPEQQEIVVTIPPSNLGK